VVKRIGRCIGSFFLFSRSVRYSLNCKSGTERGLPGGNSPRSIQLDSDLFSRRMCANVHRCPALSLGRTLDAGATARRATLPPAIQYVCCEPARAVSSVVERLVYTDRRQIDLNLSQVDSPCVCTVRAPFWIVSNGLMHAKIFPQTDKVTDKIVRHALAPLSQSGDAETRGCILEH